MAGLFAIFSLAFIAGFARYRLVAMALFFIGLAFSIGMFLHHATDVVQINL